MHGRDRRHGKRLQRKIAIRHAVQGVRCRPVETQRLCCHLAIDGEDFDAGQRQLKELGVLFLTEAFENQGNRLVFFADCDGNILHLISRPQPLP